MISASDMSRTDFFRPFGFGGGIIRLMITLFVIQTLFSFVASFFSARGEGGANKKDDSFDDF